MKYAFYLHVHFFFLIYDVFILQAYVWDNNVYLKTSPESPRQQLTTNGEPNKILNGIPDWVYEGNGIISMFSFSTRNLPIYDRIGSFF